MNNKLKIDFEREKEWWNEKAPNEEKLISDNKLPFKHSIIFPGFYIAQTRQQDKARWQ